MTTAVYEDSLRELTELNEMSVLDEETPSEIFNSFATVKEYFHNRIDDVCRVEVPDVAAYLDEHVIGWAHRVTKPINMGSIHDCVLGQVFDPNHPDNEEWTKPKLFGLIPARKKRSYSNGFVAGCSFLLARGYDDRPFVFSSYQATPFWDAEIDKRKDAQ